MAQPRKQPQDRKKAASTVQKRVRAEAAKRPAQRAAAQMRADQQPDKPVSTAAQWKKSAEGYELEVPSGNVALVRRPGMLAFLQAGILPNSLTKIVKEKMGSKGDDVEIDREALGELTFEEMIEAYDAVTLYCVVQPELHPVPEGERDPSLLYVDEVDMDDKMFIFQWAVGGTRDLESFRQQKDELAQRFSTSEAVG